MKFPYLAVVLLLAACRSAPQHENNMPVIVENKGQEEIVTFFPVTEFILGQITEIRMQGINPVKKSGNDSSWIRVEDLEKEMSDFLTPVIDTTNMTEYFEESKFLDQTINAYTFVYEPKPDKPDSITLARWIVYVDPGKNKVKSIYMEKKKQGRKSLLTWEAGKNCKMVTLAEDASGNIIVEKETNIYWDY